MAARLKEICGMRPEAIFLAGQCRGTKLLDDDGCSFETCETFPSPAHAVEEIKQRAPPTTVTNIRVLIKALSTHQLDHHPDCFCSNRLALADIHRASPRHNRCSCCSGNKPFCNEGR